MQLVTERQKDAAYDFTVFCIVVVPFMAAMCWHALVKFERHILE